MISPTSDTDLIASASISDDSVNCTGYLMLRILGVAAYLSSSAVVRVIVPNVSMMRPSLTMAVMSSSFSASLAVAASFLRSTENVSGSS